MSWFKTRKSLILNSALIAICLFVLYGALNMSLQAVMVKKETTEAKAQIEELRGEKDELEEKIRALETSDAVQREAKERLNLKLIGEEVAVIVQPDTAQNEIENKGVWEKLKSFMKKLFR